MFPILVVVAGELLAVAACVELLVRCMPRALRRASLENCYRVDGTVSEHRQSREARAGMRLRRDLAAVFAYVLLVGNGFYFLVDKAVLPMSLLSSAVSTYSPDMEDWKDALGRQWAHVELPGQSAAPTAADDLDFALRRALPAVLACSLLLLGGICVFLRFGVMKAYRDFAKGVSARDEQYFKIDMTRMAVNGSEFAVEVVAAHLNGSARE
ncbi:MAG: hypothetical protein ACTHOU_02430 [Aureliella sp.]